MIQINKEVLKEFKPCESRWKNYLEHYSDFNGTWSGFLDLDKISYDDKIWVAKKVLNKNQLIHFAVLCAQSVLSIYENKYPEDRRVGDLIAFMVTITDFSNLTEEQQIKLRELRSAAYDAAYAAYDAAYDAAAYAAAAAYAYAAAYDAAYDAAAAAYDAADAAAAAAATTDAAAAAYDAAAYSRKNQQDLNISFLKVVEGL